MANRLPKSFRYLLTDPRRTEYPASGSLLVMDRMQFARADEGIE